MRRRTAAAGTITALAGLPGGLAAVTIPFGSSLGIAALAVTAALFATGWVLNDRELHAGGTFAAAALFTPAVLASALVLFIAGGYA